MYKKLLICPFFGPLPDFFFQWKNSVDGLKQYGYDVLIDTDLDGFNKRVERYLGFRTPIIPGTGKLWDYRCALGLLYYDEISGYDFWGHTDFDVVYGKIDNFLTDEMLSELDLFSDEIDYVGGHWTIYRHCPKVNHLFRKDDVWRSLMLDPKPNGWVEKEYTETVKKSGIRYKFQMNQATRDNKGLEFKDGRLFQHGKEVMLSHFKDQKKWPL